MEQSQSVQVGRLIIHAASNVLARLQLPPEEEAPAFDYIPASQYQRLQDAFHGLIPWLQKILYLSFISIILLCTSIVSYGLFYYAAMPSTYASQHLYFDYTCGSVGCHDAPNNDMTCTSHTCTPMAMVDLFSDHAPWDAIHPDVSFPLPISHDRVLVARQPYYLEVVLHLPESDTNRNVGMFAVQVELQTSNKTVLASSIRSARLPHESNWVGVIRKTITILPLLLGTTTERRVVILPSYRRFVETLEAPLRHIVVRLLSRGKLWPAGSPIEVIFGEVRIGKELNVMQDMLKEWFYACAAIGVVLLFLVQASICILVHIWWDWRARKRHEVAARQTEEENPHDFGDTNFFVSDDEYDQWDEMPPNDTPDDEMRTPHLSSEQNLDNYDETSATAPDDDNLTERQSYAESHEMET